MGRPASRRLPAAIVLAVAALASCGASHGARTPPGRLEAIAEAQGEVALGVNTEDAPSLPPVRAFAQLAGRRPQVVMWYQTWGEPLFYMSQVRTLASQEIIPMINWHPGAGPGSGYSLAAIAGGRFDDYLRASARRAARWGRPMLIDFAQEMNIPGYAWSAGENGNTPGLYVRAWRHVVSIFRAERATNVRWVWAPNTECEGRCPFTAFYPGNAWVDWIGLDGYNLAGSPASWRQFQQIFSRSYATLTALTDKPMMIAETSSSEVGGSKSQWITNMRTSLLDALPRVRLLVWFDRLKEADWLINSSPSSLAAFREAMRLPPFSG